MPHATRSAILAALMLMLIPGSALAQQIGFVSHVEGDVELQPAGTRVWLTVALNDVVNLGDTISTGLDSSARIQLVDATVISLGERTVLFVDRFSVGDLASLEHRDRPARGDTAALRTVFRAHPGKGGFG